MATKPRHPEERIPFEWEEYPPESPANYRCRECGRRWHDNEVYPDPARKAWTCRACHSACWVYAPPGRQIWTKVECRRYRRSLWTRFWILALAEWLLLGLLFHTFVFTGDPTGGGPTSNAGRWAVSLFVVSVPNLVIWIVAALVVSGHAGKVERRHGWGPWVTWPYPETTSTR